MNSNQPDQRSKSIPPKPPVKEPGDRSKSMPAKAPIMEPGNPDPKDAGKAANEVGQREYGEGNYKATREYNEGLKHHMQTHDVDKEARDAAPRSGQEAADMQSAEEAGRSRARKHGVDQEGK